MRFFDRLFRLNGHYFFDPGWKYYGEPEYRVKRRRERKRAAFGIFTRRLLGIPIWCLLLALGLFHFVPSVKAFVNSIFKRK